VGLATAFWRFQRAGAIPWRFTLKLIPVFVLSALAGAALASVLPMDHIRLLVHIALLLALALVLLRPHRLLAADRLATARMVSPQLQLLMAGVGFWTGLIVLDAATYLLVGLVLVGGVALQQANAIKAVLIGLASLASLAVFARGGELDWGAALPLMLGSAPGGLARGRPGPWPPGPTVDLSPADLGSQRRGGGDAGAAAACLRTPTVRRRSGSGFKAER
jgi:uncharacterized membrane protein YfcA